MSLWRRIEAKMDRPLAALGVVWLILLVEFTRGIGPLLLSMVSANTRSGHTRGSLT